MDYTPLLYAAGAGGFGGVLYSYKNSLLTKVNELSAAGHIGAGALAAVIAVVIVGMAYPTGLDASLLPAIGVGYIGTEYIGAFINALPTSTAAASPPKTT